MATAAVAAVAIAAVDNLKPKKSKAQKSAPIILDANKEVHIEVQSYKVLLSWLWQNDSRNVALSTSALSVDIPVAIAGAAETLTPVNHIMGNTRVIWILRLLPASSIELGPGIRTAAAIYFSFNCRPSSSFYWRSGAFTRNHAFTLRKWGSSQNEWEYCIYNYYSEPTSFDWRCRGQGTRHRNFSVRLLI